MRNNPVARMRDARAKALLDGTAVPVAFFWDDPELLTVESDGLFEIHFNDLIDDWYGISSAMIVEALIAADGRDVLVHLNSPGGLAFEGMSISSQFRQYSGKVTMRVEGLAASAATMVMVAGDEVIIEPTAMVMIHDAWSMAVGDERELRKEADVLGKLSNSIASMYAGKAGGSAEDWRALMLEETWYTGQEAVDAGLADSVADDAGSSSENTDSAAAASDRDRWSGVYASAPRRPAARPAQRPAPKQQGTDSAAAAPAAMTGEPPAQTQTAEPEWWATLQRGLKGVQQ